MNIRCLFVAAVPVVLAATVGVMPARAQAAPPRARVQVVSVTGYNFEEQEPADVVAGDQYTALRLTYTAAHPLTDATIRVVLPRADWPTTLKTFFAFTGESPFDPADRGVVSVVPNPRLTSVGPANSCRGRGAGGTLADSDWSVQSWAQLQVITVAHVTCALYAQLVIRMKGLTDPTRPGVALLPVLVEQNGHFTQLAFGRVPVGPKPKVVLHLQTPGLVLSLVPFTIKVSATSTDPAAAAAYHGSIAVASDPVQCAQDPYASTVLAQLSINTSQDITLTLSEGTERLRAYDVANQAVPALTGNFQIQHTDKITVCPASFH